MEHHDCSVLELAQPPCDGQAHPELNIQLWTLSMSLWRAEYWAMDTLGWAHWHQSIQLWTLSGELMLSIEVWTLLGELIQSWVLSYGHSPVSWWRAEYWATDTLWWAYWHLNIQLWTLSGELMELSIEVWTLLGELWVASEQSWVTTSNILYIVKFLQ